MPGRFGNKRVTVKNLKIVKILEDKNVVLISGAIPGRKDTLIKVTVVS
jgi:large subunit ribosomal protein L3